MSVPDRERGAALLAVLLLVAVMGAISATAFEKLRLSTALAANSSETDQARAFAIGIESLVALTIDDLGVAGRDRTTLAGDWNGAMRTYPLPGGGLAQATVRDGGNCFNLNSLVEEQGTALFATRPVAVAQFITLLRLLELPEGEARRIAEAAADWADSDSVPNREGAEDSYYLGGEAPYRTGNTLFADVSELRTVAGMTPETYAAVHPWLCALPTTDLSPINVNTLTLEQAPLLAMLTAPQIDVEGARRVIALRPVSGWESLADFWTTPALQGVIAPADVQMQPQVKTRWFTVALQVELEKAELLETILIDARLAPARVAARTWGTDL